MSSKNGVSVVKVLTSIELLTPLEERANRLLDLNPLI